MDGTAEAIKCLICVLIPVLFFMFMYSKMNYDDQRRDNKRYESKIERLEDEIRELKNDLREIRRGK